MSAAGSFGNSAGPPARIHHLVYVAIALLSSIGSALLVWLAFSQATEASAASQSVAALVASTALLVAVWSVLVTRSISEQIASSSLEQRRLAANTEINRLWQQFNVEALSADAAAKADSSPDPNATEFDDARLRLVHTVLGIVRQIWLFQQLEEVGADFWGTPARYWSHRIRTAYRHEWAHIVSGHKGYDLAFLKQVVDWSAEEQVPAAALQALDAIPPWRPAPASAGKTG